MVTDPSPHHNHVTGVPPPVEDHGYKMINGVKQEMDDHNNKLPISSIAELSCGDINEYNLSYLFIVITLHGQTSSDHSAFVSS